jgi:hypothetical protein
LMLPLNKRSHGHSDQQMFITQYGGSDQAQLKNGSHG